MTTSELRPTIVQAIAATESLLTRLTAVLEDIDGQAVAIQVPRNGRWTPEKLDTLWRRVEHLTGVRALFEVTAEHPNRAVTFSEVTGRSGLDPQRQRNEHARLSRVATELFGQKYWPIENWQGNAPSGGGSAEMLYRMGGTVSAWWRQIDG